MQQERIFKKTYKETKVHVQTWEEMSAAVKTTPAVRLLVRTGRASIMPIYQLMNPFRIQENDAAPVAVDKERECREGEACENPDEDSLNLEERMWERT